MRNAHEDLFRCTRACARDARARVAQPQDINSPGTVPHAAARAGFPDKLGSSGARMSCAIARTTSAPTTICAALRFPALSVYIYPAPRCRAGSGQPPAGMVMVDRREIDLLYPGAQRTESGEAGRLARHRGRAPPPLGDRPAFGDAQRHARGGAQGIAALCYVGGDWLVKYYASSNAAFRCRGGSKRSSATALAGRGPGAIAMR